MRLQSLFLVLAVAGFWIALVTSFVRAFRAEVQRTSWSLLELLILANILGHVIALPLVYVLEDALLSSRERFHYSVAAVLCSTLVAGCMIGGAVWTFRRLKILNEARPGWRLLYMLLGLLLFPSMLLFPWNLLGGWIVWLPLYNLNVRAKLTSRSSLLSKLPDSGTAAV